MIDLKTAVSKEIAIECSGTPPLQCIHTRARTHAFTLKRTCAVLQIRFPWEL